MGCEYSRLGLALTAGLVGYVVGLLFAWGSLKLRGGNGGD